MSQAVSKVFLATVFLALALPCFAEVLAYVNSEEIVENESLLLTIEYSGIRPRKAPDISALNEDFELLSDLNSSSRLNINHRDGTFTSSGHWKISLRAKRTGKLTIPAFTVSGFTTEKIEVVVNPIDPKLREKIEGEIFFITEIDRREQYIHGAIHVDRRLYYSNNVQLSLARDLPMPTDMEDAHVVPIGRMNQPSARRNNRFYNLEVQQFVIYGEKSGQITIPPVKVIANVVVDGSYVSVPIKSASEVLNILPIPEEYPKNHAWFPATKVRVSDNLDDLDFSNAMVGDTFTRQISIEAVESYSSGIPPLELSVPEGVKQYPAPPELEDELLVNEPIGIRKQTTTYLLTQTGQIDIPAMDLVWWNTDTDELETVSLNGISFQVDINPQQAFTTTGGNSSGGNMDQIGGMFGSGGIGDFWNNHPWYMLAVIIGGWTLSILLGVALLWDRLTNKPSKTNDQSKVEEHKVINQLLRSKDTREVKAGMCQWVALKLDIDRARALNYLTEHADTRQWFNQVNRALYSSNVTEASVEYNEIKRALDSLAEHYQSNKSGTPNSNWKFYDQFQRSTI